MAYEGDAAGAGTGTSDVMRNVLKALQHPGLVKLRPTAMIYYIGITTAILCFIPLSLLAIRSADAGLQLDWLDWLLMLAPVAALAAVIVALRQTLLRINRFRLSIRQRIEDAGLMEGIAQGPGGLPDIYEHTPFPWRLMLGMRPKTLARSMQVIAYNINWYLRPEPGAYIKPEWVVILAQILLIPIIWSFPYIFIYPQGAAGHTTANTMLLVGISFCWPGIIAVMSWYGAIQNVQMILTREALAAIIRTRYGLE